MTDQEFIREVEAVIKNGLNGIIKQTPYRPISIFPQYANGVVHRVSISIELKPEAK